MTETPESSTTCVRCGRALAADEVRMAQPLITAKELITTAIKTPAALSGPPLADVAFCPECRAIIAKQRTQEQLKILVGALVILLLIAAIVMWLV